MSCLFCTIVPYKNTTFLQEQHCTNTDTDANVHTESDTDLDLDINTDTDRHTNTTDIQFKIG